MIPVSNPIRAPNTARYLRSCATTGWFSSQGSFVSRLETSFAHWLRVRYALTTTSGTSALHLALAALTIGKGDEVIVPTFTMFSPVAAILYVGATPVFVDSDPLTWTMDISQVTRSITKRTAAILAVHTYGHPVDMDPLRKLAKVHKLALIEDAAEGLGALYKNKNVGTFGDVACFSFYANKLVTTGEGGMVTTNSKRLAYRVAHLRDMAYHPKKRFLHTELGFTYRMSNMQAAVGLSYLEHINEIVKKKNTIASLYRRLLARIPYITLQSKTPWATPICWMFCVLINNKSLITRNTFRTLLYEKGIETRDFFIPAHRQPVIKKINITSTNKFPISDRISNQGLYLPSGPKLSERDIQYICQTIQTFYANMPAL